jgi:glyoxylase-like metal-dependent hydrolase (beta-lactamase superfamily II)
MWIDRSKFAAVIGMALAICRVAQVHATAPMVKTQAPGFYRMMLGDFEVTALNDGVVAYPTTRVLPKATPQQIKKALAENGLTDPVGMSYNAFLINTGSKLVLIDTGTGGKLENEPEFRGAGHLMANLRAAGYQPEQVDEVYITHLGPDHVGGLTLGTERAFPNAMLRAPTREVDIFLHPDKAPAWTRSGFRSGRTCSHRTSRPENSRASRKISGLRPASVRLQRKGTLLVIRLTLSKARDKH